MRAPRIILLCAFCLPVAAQQAYQDPRMPQTQEERQFYSAVSKAIYQVIPQEKERFVLTLGDRADPIFPGEGTNGFEQVPCEKRAAFRPVGFANDLGGFTAAACKNGARVRELSAKSRARLAAMLKSLPIVKDEDARKIGWYYELETLSDGSELHYFPVLAIGHGVVAVYTAALYDKKSGTAVIVQATPYPMCENFRKDYEPFCADVRKGLKRMALTLQGSL
jgi:hypothetical protein